MELPKEKSFNVEEHIQARQEMFTAFADAMAHRDYGTAIGCAIKLNMDDTTISLLAIAREIFLI